MTETTTRRLAAVLAADVVGYSRLVAEDEAGTIARLRALFQGTVQPTVVAHRGRVFKLMGDAFLAEFSSAVGAAECALALQASMAGTEPEVAEDRRIRLRIGLHLGDVLVQGGDLLGNGVNIAARLEGVAEPGGVVASAAVADAIRGRVDCALDDLGEPTLKNIATPVRVFRLRPGAMTLPAVASDKPALAILPFANMSGDAAQEYFADGITEDIITAVSRLRWVPVIARNSTFTYKGRAVDVKQVGRELGVRYVLEGSVRCAGGRLRITGQLIEAETGTHVWADRYDGAAEDVFELQDRISAAVTAAIEPRLRQAEIERARRRPVANLTAYERTLWAHPRVIGETTRETHEAGMAHLRETIRMAPDFAPAHAILAQGHVVRAAQNWAHDVEATRAEAVRAARQALALEREDPLLTVRAAHALAYCGGEWEEAIGLCERALTLNPHTAEGHAYTGWVHLYGGDGEAALRHFERATVLSPLDDRSDHFVSGKALALVFQGRDAAAIEAARHALRINPNWMTSHRVLMAALALDGRLAEARAVAQGAKGRGARPSTTVRWRPGPGIERYLEGLRLAGLPD